MLSTSTLQIPLNHSMKELKNTLKKRNKKLHQKSKEKPKSFQKAIKEIRNK